MRILTFGNAPYAWRGYGTQAAQLVPRLLGLGHDVAIAAFHGLHGAPLWWNGILIYPGSTEDMWAQDVLKGHYDHHQADLLLTIMDAWVMNPQVVSTMNAAHWMPIDCSPAVGDGPENPRRRGRAAHRHERVRPPPASRRRVGSPVRAACDRHAVFAPHAEREAVREETGTAGRFLIGINAANQDPLRKGFSEQFEAFAQFRRAHPEALLLVNARAVTNQGLNLQSLAAELGLSDDCVQFCDQYLYAAGLTGQDKMARWYGLLDLLSNCSFGEGFGLPVLEAQACGTPVVVTDCSAMTELCGSGFLVEGSRWWNKGHAAHWVRPSVEGILGAYEEAFALWQSGGLEAYREKARSFALQYDADRVLTEYWVDVLAELSA